MHLRAPASSDRDPPATSPEDIFDFREMAGAWVVRPANAGDTAGVLRCLEAFHDEHQLVEEGGGTGESFDADEYARWMPCGADTAMFVAECSAGKVRGVPVSYTHLTLPTICSV